MLKKRSRPPVLQLASETGAVRGRGLGFLLIGPVLLAAVIWRSGLDPESRIRALAGELAVDAGFAAKAHPLEAASYGVMLARSFTPDVSLTLLTDEGEREYLRGRKALADKLALVRSRLASLSVEANELQVRVHGDTATVEFVGRALGRSVDADEHFLEEHRIRAELRNEDGEWRIAHAQNIEPLTE